MSGNSLIDTRMLNLLDAEIDARVFMCRVQVTHPGKVNDLGASKTCIALMDSTTIARPNERQAENTIQTPVDNKLGNIFYRRTIACKHRRKRGIPRVTKMVMEGKGIVDVDDFIKKTLLVRNRKMHQMEHTI